MAYIGLDSSKHERTAPLAKSNPLPPQIYHGIITRTQLKNIKDNTGLYLEVEFDITHPSEYNKRKFWDRFNIQNKSADAARIAKEQLSDLVKASGLTVLNEDTDLHGKEVALVLRIQESTNPQYPDPKNECEKYWPIGTTQAQHDKWRKGGKKVGVTPPPASAEPQAVPVQKAAAPWKRS